MTTAEKMLIYFQSFNLMHYNKKGIEIWTDGFIQKQKENESPLNLCPNKDKKM